MTLPALPSTALGLTWRPITPDDVPAWHELVRAIEDVDDPGERYTAEDLRDQLTDGSWKDPSADTLMGVDADGVPRAFGHVEVRPGDTRAVRAFCWGGVHPQWRGRGIGREVLAWQERRGREKIAAAGKDVPSRILVHADEHVGTQRRLLEAAGFRLVRWYLEMTRPLDDAHPAPDVALDGGLRLVPYTDDLSERVRHAHNEAFADHWGSEPRSHEDWERASVGGRAFRPQWSFVVLDGDEVAGYTLASAYEQDWAAQGYRSGWTDALGVRRAWRRRGIAPALLAASMRAFRADGMERADLAVDAENPSGALRLYTGLGFTAARRSTAYAKDC
ncbi:GNAT family N-acetyltransferase [Georgenia faecalis]|uniref:GNAT family N-acetyltransferase n=1 Tax=Georgenia faecalis TaxID=2483799 RepID=UPI000FDC7A5D|nr:GNAT family N-acetyltransferase [Georgenia faecalis]